MKGFCGTRPRRQESEGRREGANSDSRHSLRAAISPVVSVALFVSPGFSISNNERTPTISGRKLVKLFPAGPRLKGSSTETHDRRRAAPRLLAKSHSSSFSRLS